MWMSCHVKDNIHIESIKKIYKIICKKEKIEMTHSFFFPKRIERTLLAQLKK